MTERTAALEYKRTQRQLQLAVSCLSPVVVMMAVEPHGPARLATPFFRLRGIGRYLGRTEAVLEATRVGSGYTSLTSHYRHTIRSEDGREALSWHLHGSAYTSPHLHLGAGLGTFDIDLSRAHVPTGLVSVQEFMRFLIRDLGAKPARPDWHAVLASLDGT